MKISALFCYPVKGLSGEPLPDATLTKGAYFPLDRLYAIENGPSGFDPAAPVWAPKIRFLQLMRDEQLARFSAVYDEATCVLTLREDGEVVAQGDLSTQAGRDEIADFLAPYRRDDMHGPTRTLTAPPGFRFTDSTKGFVSLINAASVADISRRVGRDVDARRFRGNILVEGLPAWGEFDLVGKTLAIGDARLVVTKRIERCAATNVDPATGKRDMEIPRLLLRDLGHADCGVYARVAQSGRIAVDDAVVVEQGDLLGG
jgi:hypothetical protein